MIGPLKSLLHPIAGRVAFAIALAWAVGCAVPVAPSGGPPDREPPQVVAMNPVNNAVNFSGTRVEFVFNEHVDEGSFQQSLEITPEPATEPELKWSGRRVEIRFRERLEENTTYILTIGTRLRDLRNVALKAPITRAFSTGPEINKARISGRIVDPFDGTGVAALQVFAYSITDTIATGALSDRPLYRTETDESGNFEFNYLSSRPYFVLGVRDRNSNRKPDNMEVVAVPPIIELPADTAAARTETPWYAAVFDTVSPEVRRIEAVSASLVSVRYSEDVFFDIESPQNWTILDSTGATIGSGILLYRPNDNMRTILVGVAPLQRGTYLMTPGPVADSAGNYASRRRLELLSEGRADTARIRLATFVPPDDAEVVSLGPDERAGFKLSAPGDTSVIAGRISVVDTAGSPINFTVRTKNQVDYSLEVPDLPADGLFEVRWRRVDSLDEDSVVTQRFRQFTARDVGAISGVLIGYPDSSRVVIGAITRTHRTPRAFSHVGKDGRFQLTGLRPGSYRLRLFRDDNRNDRWDSGRITPYRRPEPIFWTSDSLRVRARWETETDTLEITGFNPIAR